MPISESQKKASNKYNKEHMATLGCKVRKEQAAAFKQYASNCGKTSNTVLKEYVLQCIKVEIQAHADARGESLNAFMNRAADETMQRDKGQGAGTE